MGPTSEENGTHDSPPKLPQDDQAETALRLANLLQQLSGTATQLEAVLDSVENGIVMLDRDFVVRLFNLRMAEWFAVPPEHVIGRRLEDLTAILKPHLQDPDLFEQSLVGLFQHPERTLRDEIVVVTPTYKVLRRFGTAAYDRDGHLLGRLAVFSDVTEQRRLEHLRDEFLSVAAHEFKTPITVIKGYAELLLKRPPHAENQQERK